jgi:membrane-bound ClpP family serine protease
MLDRPDLLCVIVSLILVIVGLEVSQVVGWLGIVLISVGFILICFEFFCIIKWMEDERRARRSGQ